MTFRYALIGAIALLSGCSSLGGGNMPSRDVVAVCGALPPDADLSRSEDVIVRWCRQGVYLTRSGTLAPLKVDTPGQPGNASWDGGRMPEIEGVENEGVEASAGSAQPIVLEIPENE